MKERWFSWTTALAAVLAALVLLTQVLLDHRARERAAAADMRRDLMGLAHAVKVLERRLKAGSQRFEAAACNETKVEVRLTDARAEKRSLSAVLEMRADLVALGAANWLASLDEAVDGVAFASARLTGEPSSLGAASELLGQRVREMSPGVPADDSHGSPPEQPGAQAAGSAAGGAAANEVVPSGSGGGAEPSAEEEKECKSHLASTLPKSEEAEKLAEFLRTAAERLAALPDCELAALAAANAGERLDGREGLERLMGTLGGGAEGEPGEPSGGNELRGLFDGIEWDPAPAS